MSRCARHSAQAASAFSALVAWLLSLGLQVIFRLTSQGFSIVTSGDVLWCAFLGWKHISTNTEGWPISDHRGWNMATLLTPVMNIDVCVHAHSGPKFPSPHFQWFFNSTCSEGLLCQWLLEYLVRERTTLYKLMNRKKTHTHTHTHADLRAHNPSTHRVLLSLGGQAVQPPGTEEACRPLRESEQAVYSNEALLGCAATRKMAFLEQGLRRALSTPGNSLLWLIHISCSVAWNKKNDHLVPC